jgi:hypothetical protein
VSEFRSPSTARPAEIKLMMPDAAYINRQSAASKQDRFALVRDRELSDLIDGLLWAFDELDRGDAFHRGCLSDDRVVTLTVIKDAITYLLDLRERQS